MSEKILLEYQVATDGLKAEFSEVKAEMKSVESAGVKSADNTSKAFAKTEEKTRSLKAQLKDLKAALAVATDPKDIDRLARAAGKLEDQIGDAADAARVFASDSAFEQIGNAIGSVGGKLRNLDFAGAAQQSKLLLSATKSLTFKEALGGIKDLGSTLLNIGKSLLMNPIFLIGGAVVAIIANFDKLKSSGGAIGSVFSFIGDVIDGVIKSFTTLTDAIGLTDIAGQKLVENQIKQYQELSNATQMMADREIKIRKAAGEKTEEIEKKKLQGIIDNATKQYRLLVALERSGTKLTEDQLKQREEFVKAAFDADTELKTLEATAQKEARERTKKHLEDLANLEKILRDLRAQNIVEDDQRKITQLTNTFNDEKEKYKGQNDIIKELQIKLNRDIEQVYKDRQASNNKILQDAARDAIKIFKEGEKEIAGEDVAISARLKNSVKAYDDAEKEKTEALKKQLELRKQLQQEGWAFAHNLISTAQTINSNIAQTQIDEANEKSNAEIVALKNQYEQGIISKEEYEKRKGAIDKKTQAEEARIKKKAFETNKQLALIQVVISTAQAIAKTASELGYPAALPFIALAAANAALQIAAIQSQPTPKFAKGVVDLKGKGTGTSDEIHAMLSKGESVITADATSQYSGLLKAMNKNQAGKFIKEFYIAPALKAQRKKYEEKKDRVFADSLARSLSGSNGFKDGNLLESLKAVRKNDRDIAHFIVKELKGSQRSNHKW